MAAGDIKGDNTEVIKITLGATAAKGDVLHLESDGKWDPVVAGDTGKFAVAREAGEDGDEILAVVKGKVEVGATAAAIARGAYVVAGSTGKVAQAAAPDATTLVGSIMGYAFREFASSGNSTIDLTG